MSVVERSIAKPRPVYLNLFAIRQPLPAIVSILHRVSGALLFLFGIPILLAGVDSSLNSADTYAGLKSVLAHPLAKLVVLGLTWAYFHHLLAGLRHLLHDIGVGGSLKATRQYAALVMALAIVLTLLVAVRLW